MTTRILVVNYGPQPVEVQKSTDSLESQGGLPTVVYPLQSVDFYVYKGQVIVVREQERKEEAA